MEKVAASRGSDLTTMTLEEQDVIWDAVKLSERADEG